LSGKSDFAESLGSAFYTRDLVYDQMTAGILDLVPHLTEAIVEQSSAPGLQIDDVKWVSVETNKNTEQVRYLQVIGMLKIQDDVIQIHGRVPMDVVLHQDKRKIHEYFESQRNIHKFESAVKKESTLVH